MPDLPSPLPVTIARSCVNSQMRQRTRGMSAQAAFCRLSYFAKKKKNAGCYSARVNSVIIVRDGSVNGPVSINLCQPHTQLRRTVIVCTMHPNRLEAVKIRQTSQSKKAEIKYHVLDIEIDDHGEAACSTGICEQYPEEIKLFRYSEIPDFLKGNPWVIDGYRVFLPFGLCVKRFVKSLLCLRTVLCITLQSIPHMILN